MEARGESHFFVQYEARHQLFDWCIKLVFQQAPEEPLESWNVNIVLFKGYSRVQRQLQHEQNIDHLL